MKTKSSLTYAFLSPISNKTANARISDIFQTPKNSKIEKN